MLFNWWKHSSNQKAKIMAENAVDNINEQKSEKEIQVERERNRVGLHMVKNFHCKGSSESTFAEKKLIKKTHFTHFLERRISIILPLSSFNLIWQTFTVVVVLAGLVLMPYEMLIPYFGKDRLDNEHPLYIMGYCIDILLLIDILVTLNTAFYDSDQEIYITDRRRIAHKYIRTWLLPDIMASFPFTPIIVAFRNDKQGHLTKFLRILRLFRIVKLTRFIKLVRLFKAINASNIWEDDFKSELMHSFAELGILIVSLLLIAHYSACIFVALAKGDEDGWNHLSWVHAYLFQEELFTNNNKYDDLHDLDFYNVSTFRIYIISLYWAFTTLTTVGYGDIVPRKNSEMLWAMVVQFVGSCILGYIFSQVVIIFTREDRSKQIIKAKIATLNSYMRHRKLPNELKLLIRRHYTYAWKVCAFDEKAILDDLPANVRDRIIMSLNRPVLDKIKFLSSLNAQVKAALCMQLTSMQILSGDAVVVEGEVGTFAFFVKNGHLSAFINAASTVAKSLNIHCELAVLQFSDGDIFCEYCLLQGRSTKHPYTVKAANNQTYCEILSFSQTAFKRLAIEFPSLEEVFRDLAIDRLQELMDALSSRRKLRAIARSDSDKPTVLKQTSSFSMNSPPSLKKISNSLSSRFSWTYSMDRNPLEDDKINHPEAIELREDLDRSLRELDPLRGLTNHYKLQTQLWAKRSKLKVALRESKSMNDLSLFEEKPRLSLSDILDSYDSTDKFGISGKKPSSAASSPTIFPKKKGAYSMGCTPVSRHLDDRIAAIETTVSRLADTVDSIARHLDISKHNYLNVTPNIGSNSLLAPSLPPLKVGTEGLNSTSILEKIPYMKMNN